MNAVEKKAKEAFETDISMLRMSHSAGVVWNLTLIRNGVASAIHVTLRKKISELLD